MEIGQSYVEVAIPKPYKNKLKMNFGEKKALCYQFFPQTGTAPAVTGNLEPSDRLAFGPWEKDGGPPENHTDTERTRTLHTERHQAMNKTCGCSAVELQLIKTKTKKTILIFKCVNKTLWWNWIRLNKPPVLFFLRDLRVSCPAAVIHLDSHLAPLTVCCFKSLFVSVASYLALGTLNGLQHI